MVKRLFADGVMSVTVSDDKTFVGLTFANRPWGNKETKAEEAFEVVMPTPGFLAMAKFFTGLNEKLGLPEAPAKEKADG
ncbi:MAG: hypothetical protein IKX21_04785 [Deltaproteobacteria bacterium]|nr:hypothetical protein [Deltaproteobacteria bacterium]